MSLYRIADTHVTAYQVCTWCGTETPPGHFDTCRHCGLDACVACLSSTRHADVCAWWDGQLREQAKVEDAERDSEPEGDITW